LARLGPPNPIRVSEAFNRKELMPLGEYIRGFRASIKGDTDNPSNNIDIVE